MNLKSLVLLFLSVTFILLFSSCESKEKSRTVGVSSFEVVDSSAMEVIPGAEHIAEYYKHLEGKSVALVVNQTSRIGDNHLVDSLVKLKINIAKIFAPEHGFRGEADAGEKIDNEVDRKTNIPLISLYGKFRKPAPKDLEGVDVLVFDIQDVGVRFYTYLSTLHNVMEAAAENNIPVLLLDRPNPNGHYIDGPVLDLNFSSFVGMHPVPIVYGMTIGEYAQMINGEGWLSNGIKANLNVIPITNYSHDSFYDLPVKPSPNLPNIKSIYLYPSLCLFEGTTMSIGRGTNLQFQVIGHPSLASTSDFHFTPVSMPGAKYPKHENLKCGGVSLESLTIGSIRDQAKFDLSYLIDYYEKMKSKNVPYFLENNFIDKLAGTDQLRIQIINGKTEEEIRSSWEEELEHFKAVRAKYLIYD